MKTYIFTIGLHWMVDPGLLAIERCQIDEEPQYLNNDHNFRHARARRLQLGQKTDRENCVRQLQSTQRTRYRWLLRPQRQATKNRRVYRLSELRSQMENRPCLSIRNLGHGQSGRQPKSAGKRKTKTRKNHRPEASRRTQKANNPINPVVR